VKSDSTSSGDARDKKIIAGLKDRIDFLENELRLKQNESSPDIAERNQANMALQESEENFRALFESAGAAIFVADVATGMIIDCNAKAEELIGLPREEIVGLHQTQLHPADMAVERRESFLRNASEGGTINYETAVQHRAGMVIPVIINAAKLKVNNMDIMLGVFIDISERKRAEEVLQTTLQRFYTILSNVHGAILLVTEEGRVEYTNEIFCKYFYLNERPADLVGLTGPDIIGKIRNTYHNPDQAIARIQETVEHWEQVIGEEVAMSDGRTCLRDFIPLSIDGKRYGRLWYHFDITERKRAEKALMLTQFSIDRAADMALWVAPDGRFIYANEAACKAFGYTREEFLSRTTFDTNPYFNEENWGEHWREVKDRGSFTFEAKLRRKDSTFFPGEITVNYLVYEGKEYNCAYIRDITERKLAEEAMMIADVRFRSLIQNSSDIIRILDREGRIIYESPSSEKILGYPPGYTLGKSPFEFIHPDDRERVRNDLGEVYDGRNPGTPTEFRIRKADGSYLEVESMGKNMIGVPGVDGIVITTRPITERKRVEKALINEKYILTKSQEVAHLGNWAWNVKTGELTGSAENYRIYGYEPGEVKATPDWVLSRVHPEDRTILANFLEANARDGRRGSIDFRVVRPDGSVVYVNTIVDKVVKDRTGSVKRLYGISQDVTERKRAEDELKAAKLQAELYVDLMGHDINNMHQVALGYLELARDLPAGADQAAFMDKSMEVLQRSTKLIGNVRKLQKLREGLFEVRDIDVCNMLADVQSEYEAVSGKMVTLNLNGHDHCSVHANELLHDVFSNLVNNAVKHTGEGTEIIMDLDVVLDNARCYCRVAVEDNGSGIPDGSKERIFNRMHKGTARGMGLGLYLVRTLVESYNGKVWVEDRVKGDHTKGARFVVLLPAAGK
jgi:PAS domain S-box-containing protein